MRAQTYPQYKDSGIEWLGQIPAHWAAMRVDALARMKSEQALPSDLGVEEVFHYSIPVVQKTRDGRTESVSDIASAKLVLHGDELLISKLNPRKGNVLLAWPHNIPTVCSGEYVPLRIAAPEAASRQFMLYLYLSEFARQSISSVVQSATRSHQRATPDVISKLWAAFPPKREQQAIADFLDRETAKIAALVEKKEWLIELLREKRTALITHAVIKGLDPNVPMRRSGIEWLGQIPAHWDRGAIRHLCSLVRDGTHQPPSRVVDGFRLLSVRNIIDGRFVFRDDDSRISETDFQTLERSFAIHQNDVLLAIVGATLGKVAIVDELPEPFTIQRSLAVLRPQSGVLEAGYLAYLILGSSFQQLLWASAGYSAQPGLYLNTLGGFRIPLPGLAEQQAIANFLDRETARIDALIAKVCEAIEQLKEYRTALISAAVTGKIDVREAAR